MQKTRLGISVGLLGAALYFVGFFSGYLGAVLLAGYVLLFEENEWLKKSAVKAVAVLILFSFLSAVVNLLPNALGMVDDIAAIFGGNVQVVLLNNIVAAIGSILNIVEKILFLALGVKALSQGTVAVPVVDNLIRKYMG